MRTIAAILLLTAVAAPAHARCLGTTCITDPTMDQRLAVAAYLAHHSAADGIACDAVSGARRVGCTVLAGMAADVRRAARFEVLAKGWTQNQRDLFAKLLVAEDKFARAVGENETDRTASDAGLDAITAQQAEKQAFAHTLERIASGQPGRLSLVAFADADAGLNDAYAQVMAVGDTSDLAWGTVDKIGILRTQRAWLAYRDAFVTFAAALEADTAALKSDLTQRRTVSLQGFLED